MVNIYSYIHFPARRLLPFLGPLCVKDFCVERPCNLEDYFGNFDVIFLCCDVNKPSNLEINTQNKEVLRFYLGYKKIENTS